MFSVLKAVACDRFNLVSLEN